MPLKSKMKRSTRPRTGKKVKVTTTVRVPKMKPTLQAGVLSVVRRMLHRSAENKLVGNAVETNVKHNSPIGGADCEPLIPTIKPVNVDNTTSTSMLRIGDKISPRSLKVKGVLSFQPDTCTTQQNLYARIIIASQKSIKVGSQVLAGSVDTNRLLRPNLVPGSEQVPFDGSTEALNFSINTEAFRVYYDKVVKLTSGIPSSGGYGDAPMPQYSTRWSYRFKKLPASLTFDEGNGDWPNNFAPFVAIGYAFSDGTSPDLVTTKLISNVTSFLEFEDM